MVLNQIIKARLQPIVGSMGRSLGSLGVTPNILTWTSFALSLAAGLLFAFKPAQPYFAALSIVGAGILDLLDGAVARATNAFLPGSLNDSTFDRISEIAIYAGIIFAGYGVSGTMVLLTLGISLLSSYIRAKGESLGIALSSLGVGDRADRTLPLIVFALAGYVWIGIYANLVVVTIACVHRYIRISRAIKETKKAVKEGEQLQSSST